MGEGTQKNWVLEGSGKGNIGGTERGESTVPRRPVHMGPQTIYGFDCKKLSRSVRILKSKVPCGGHYELLRCIVAMPWCSRK
jgi:hypothetical protein